MVKDRHIVNNLIETFINKKKNRRIPLAYSLDINNMKRMNEIWEEITNTT
ncbi:44084_t:CDS:2 [Gigaspora margarita]|uniref:44084_t:CDS:1 n=1 Tax=Gigaspora margarita TaxID=4874 RepID=A0ABM8VX68_GIGMA|nr:44084_t:CDS:2 [Gigaspora margarita]